MSDRLPGAVLFACTANHVRSPMAEGLMRAFYGSQVFVDSCGVAPKDDLDPFTAAVLEEIGCGLKSHTPKSFADLNDASFDVIVALTAEASLRAGDMAHGCAVERLYWPTLDPSLNAGSREGMLDAYRALREELKARIFQRFGPPIEVAAQGGG
jgi:protein-tyrosine-phosphatase